MNLTAASFRRVVSGQERGPLASLARAALRVAEFPYATAMRLRNRRYDRRRGVVRVDVPVVSVGNLTLGGTGKTPLIAWLARWFRERGVRVAIVSRGYGSPDGGPNDEALELEDLLPDVPHVQDPDRVAMARLAVEEFESQLLLLDDGFQHRRLHRDLDVVVLDALDPWGSGHVFPRGLLREPASGLARAHVVVLSRAGQVSSESRAAIAQRARQLAPGAAWVEIAQRPRALRTAAGEEFAISSWAGKRVGAFCGLGNPEGFWRTLADAGLEPAGRRDFPDHHCYTRDDVLALGQWARQEGLEALLCTHKDLVKLDAVQIVGVPLAALVIDLELLSGRQALEDKLRGLLPPADSA